MEAHQIRYFLALCETLNFTRAAEACNVSQPSLTRAIHGLEEELGGQLFNRERNHSHLTDLGRLMKPYLEQVWANMKAARKRADQITKLKELPLSVGIMCTIGPTKLVDFFRNFHDRHPGVDLNLVDGTAESLHELLTKGDLDVALYGLPSGVDDRFHEQPLFSERFVITVPNDHHFASRDIIRFKDLNGERYLVRWNCEVWQQFQAALAEQGVEPLRPYRSERDDWIQAMVLAGLGFGFFPESAVVMTGLLKLPLVEPEIRRTVNLVTVRGRPHAPAVGAFVREALRYNWRDMGGMASVRAAAR
ncbi:MAG: LysR family transcriptional regulator [Dongiaceae bacterium]